MTTSVTLVTQAECSFCDQAKDVLDRLADDFDLRVQVVGLEDAEGQLLAEASGLVFPPGVFIDGDLFSYGRLSERKLRRHLRTRSDHQQASRSSD